MKKYLMGGIAAVAICAAFTSCSKNNDIYDQNAAEQIKQQTSEQKILDSYQKAFENAFGQPGANQDWGLAKYGSVTNAGTRAIIAEINDPFTKYTNTDSYYKSEIPSTAKTPDDYKRDDWGGKIDENALQGCTEFKFENGTFGIHCWQGSRDIYVNGIVTMNVDNTNSLNQARIYLLPNSTLHFNMSHYINNLEIYVANGATLNYNAEQLYKQTGGGIIFNHGTLNVPDNFEINQDAIVYNEGTINGKNITSKPGDGHPSYFYNYGDLDLKGDFELNSCANFYNEGKVTVEGETSVTQKNIYWINKGHYTTGTMVFSAKNSTFYNYCNLLVLGNAHMYDGEFNLMNNSYTEAATADFDNFIVNMGDNSGFNIKGNTNWAAQGDGTYQGFRTTTGANNVYVRLGGTTTVAGHLHSLELTGNITYAINKIVDLGEGNSGVQPTYVFNAGTTEAPFDQLTVTPKEFGQGCGASWNIPPVIVYQGSVMGEDLTAETDNDFDFNDVVFDWAFSADKKTAYIRLRAAGGTLPLRIGTAVGQGEEVHELFGVSTSTMVNTGVGANGITKEPVEFTITKTTGTFNNAADIIVSVDKTSKGSNGYMQMTAKIGQAPCLLFVPLNTKWVDEYENIEKAYTWFGAWSRGEGTTDQWSAPVAKFVDLDLSNNK